MLLICPHCERMDVSKAHLQMQSKNLTNKGRKLSTAAFMLSVDSREEGVARTR